jgi:hypothetical protein
VAAGQDGTGDRRPALGRSVLEPEEKLHSLRLLTDGHPVPDPALPAGTPIPAHIAARAGTPVSPRYP